MNHQQAVSPEEYERLVKEQCPFCKIGDGKIPAKTVYEDGQVVAFLDINPANPGHILIVPKKHYTVLPQMSDPDVAHIFKVAKRLAGIVFELVQKSSPDKPAGVNVLQNNGAAAGQQVPHVHVHVIPRVEGDGVLPPWTPQKVEDSQMEQIRAMITTAMQKMPVAPSDVQNVPQLPTAYQEEKEEPKNKKKLKQMPRSP